MLTGYPGFGRLAKTAQAFPIAVTSVSFLPGRLPGSGRYVNIKKETICARKGGVKYQSTLAFSRDLILSSEYLTSTPFLMWCPYIARFLKNKRE